MFQYMPLVSRNTLIFFPSIFVKYCYVISKIELLTRCFRSSNTFYEVLIYFFPTLSQSGNINAKVHEVHLHCYINC